MTELTPEAKGLLGALDKKHLENIEAIQRVRELHKPFTYVWNGEKRESGLCVECEDQDYPCDTIKALDGEQ